MPGRSSRPGSEAREAQRLPTDSRSEASEAAWLDVKNSDQLQLLPLDRWFGSLGSMSLLF